MRRHPGPIGEGTLWERIDYELERVSDSFQALETLDACGESPAPQLQELVSWPDGTAVSQAYECGLTGQQSLVVSPDGANAYLSSRDSGFLIAFRCDRKSGELQEYCRVQLGFTQGGVSAVAVGGVWVFAACEVEDRVLVLRLCHDWYQDRTRLLLMRVLSEVGGPMGLAATADGRLVAVAFRRESMIRVYRCRMNGRLEPFAQHYLSESVRGLEFGAKAETLIVHGTVGTHAIALESIF